MERSIQRVKQRLEEGGHDVPLDAVIRRFERSKENLQRATQLADHIRVYDNSYGYKRLLFSK